MHVRKKRVQPRAHDVDDAIEPKEDNVDVGAGHHRGADGGIRIKRTLKAKSRVPGQDRDYKNGDLVDVFADLPLGAGVKDEM